MSLTDARRKALAAKQIHTEQDVLDAFQLSEVEDPTFFFARQDVVSAIVEVVATGRHAVLFGQRGTGKSSAAMMLSQIASGHLDLLDYYGGKERLQRRRETFWGATKITTAKADVIWVDCGKEDRLEDLYWKMANKIAAQIQDNTKKSLFEMSVNAQFAGTGGGLGFKVEREQHDRPSYTPRQYFQASLTAFHQIHENARLVFVIDEFDLVHGGGGIATALKTSHGTTQYVLVGIADQIDELVSEHQSISRTTIPIEIESMNDDEIREVLEGYLTVFGRVFSVSREDQTALLSAAQGVGVFPEGVLAQ